MSASNAAYIVLDEAHLVVEQGYTFRPDYLRLGSLRAAFPGVPIYCFSATCTAYVRQDLQALLRLRAPRHFAVPDARDNMHLCVHHTRKGARTLVHARIHAMTTGTPGTPRTSLERPHHHQQHQHSKTKRAP